MRIAVPAETVDEPRVAATPETVKKLLGLGATVAVQAGAGVASGVTDAAFVAAGATVEPDLAATLRDADVVLKVRRPEAGELAHYRRGAVVIAIMDPYGQDEALQAMAGAGLDAFAMELMPRITRAQVDGRAFEPGQSCGLPRGDRCRRAIWPRLPDDDDRGGYRAGRQGLRHGGRGRGPAGHRHRAAPRGHRHRDRCAACDEGAGRVARRQIRGGRERGVQAGRDGKAGYAKRDVGRLSAPAEPSSSPAHIAKQDVVITTALIPGPAGTKARLGRHRVASMRPGSIVFDHCGRARRQLRSCRGPARWSRTNGVKDGRLPQCAGSPRRNGLWPLCPKSFRLRRDARLPGQDGQAGESRLERRIGQGNQRSPAMAPWCIPSFAAGSPHDKVISPHPWGSGTPARRPLLRSSPRRRGSSGKSRPKATALAPRAPWPLDPRLRGDERKLGQERRRTPIQPLPAMTPI